MCGLCGGGIRGTPSLPGKPCRPGTRVFPAAASDGVAFQPPHQSEAFLIVLGAEDRLLPAVPRWVMWWGIPGATPRARRTMAHLSSSPASKSRIQCGVPGIPIEHLVMPDHGGGGAHALGL